MSTHFLFTAQAHHKSRTLGEADVTAVDSVKVAELKKAAADGLITAAELDEALADMQLKSPLLANNGNI